jgi:hypothetical protein
MKRAAGRFVFHQGRWSDPGSASTIDRYAFATQAYTDAAVGCSSRDRELSSVDAESKLLEWAESPRCVGSVGLFRSDFDLPQLSDSPPRAYRQSGSSLDFRPWRSTSSGGVGIAGLGGCDLLFRFADECLQPFPCEGIAGGGREAARLRQPAAELFLCLVVQRLSPDARYNTLNIGLVRF